MVETMVDKNRAQSDGGGLFDELFCVMGVTLGFEAWHEKRKSCQHWRWGV